MRGKAVLVTGGTGSLGRVLVRRLIDEYNPRRVIVFSRDESKQEDMRREFDGVEFWIGDIRDYAAVSAVLRGVDVVFNAAAIKQVPTCEYFPSEAVATNVGGAENLIRAVAQQPVETVVGISTDKACKPVNVMGMTKAIQERMFTRANLGSDTRFCSVRYGNVMMSRGSVIPLFQSQIAQGGPVTLTTAEMTRFMLTLDDAVDTVLAAERLTHPGETLVPQAPSSLVIDIARALIGDQLIEVKEVGIRPGEKVHEIMVNDEEALRTRLVEGWFGVGPMLPELAYPIGLPALDGEYSSASSVLDYEATRALVEGL